MPRRWLFVTVSCPSALALDLHAEGLIAAGATSVEQQATSLATYFPEPADPAAFLDALRADLRSAGGEEPELAWEWREDADWIREWRRGLDARRVGRRLVVTPSWITPAAGPEDVVITIDPQMAFGTGEHATTRGVLRLMEARVAPGGRVLDVGTGSGILAIAAARLGAAHALGVESDADALINAAENVVANGVGGRVELLHGLVDVPFLESRAGHFQLILANVLSSVLLPLLPAFHTALTPGGYLVLSGILQAEAEMMQAAATAAGLEAVQEDREEEWWTGLYRRPVDAPAGS